MSYNFQSFSVDFITVQNHVTKHGISCVIQKKVQAIIQENYIDLWKVKCLVNF